MPHQSRKPSSKLVLENKLFNKMVGILEIAENMNIEEENLSAVASKLKEKLLLYTVPRTSEDDIEFADVRFFPNEASNMIWELLMQVDLEPNKDYYSILKSNRENR